MAKKNPLAKFEEAVAEMMAAGLDENDIVELAAGEATSGLEAADVRSRMFKSPDNPLKPTRGGQPLRGKATSLTGAPPLRKATAAELNRRVDPSAWSTMRENAKPAWATGPAPDIEKLRGRPAIAGLAGPAFEPEIDEGLAIRRAGAQNARRAAGYRAAGLKGSRLSKAVGAARGLKGRAASTAARAAAKMGVGGLLGTIAMPALAAYTAYEVGSGILDATEGRDQEVRASRAMGELAFQEGVSEDIDIGMIEAENRAARGMGATDQAIGSLLGERRAYIAEEIGSVVRDRAEEIAQMQYVSGPSPLEIQATMQSLLR